MHGIVDEKTDVFAFGVLLLELITGRRPVDSSGQNLVMWVRWRELGFGVGLVKVCTSLQLCHMGGRTDDLFSASFRLDHCWRRTICRIL